MRYEYSRSFDARRKCFVSFAYEKLIHSGFMSQSQMIGDFLCAVRIKLREKINSFGKTFLKLRNLNETDHTL